MEFDASHAEGSREGRIVLDVRRRKARSGKRAKSEKQEGRAELYPFRGVGRRDDGER